MAPEQKAIVSIDALLQQAGWHVCNVSDPNIHAATGVAIREVLVESRPIYNAPKREDTQLCHWHFQSKGEQ
jgi:hypothetical protein